MSGARTCIESHPVDERGLLIEASAGENDETIYKKYRYEKAELGLESNETISAIYIGSSGFLGDPKKCFMFIKTYTRTLQEGTSTYDYKYYLHLYTYHLNDNGVIGKEYNGARYEIQRYKEEIPYDYVIVFSNTDPSTFFLIRAFYITYTASVSYYTGIRKCHVSYIADVEGNLNIHYVLGTEVRYSGSSTGLKDLNITLDDHYIYCCSAGWSSNAGFVVELDENLNPISSSFSQTLDSGNGILTNTDQKLTCTPQKNFYLYSKSNESWVLNKQISFSYTQDSVQNQWIQGNMIITPDNSRVILLTSERSGSGNNYRKNTTLRVAVFSVNDILNANSGDVINPVQYSSLTFNGREFQTTSNLFNIVTNLDGTIIFVYANSSGASYNAQMWTLSVENSQQLLGVRYKNQFFRSMESGMLSATVADVTNGKTFIGYDGTVQTGTLTQ